MKLTGPSACTLQSNSIPLTDGTNGLLRLVTYISQTGHQCFPAYFCHPTVENFDLYPDYFIKKYFILPMSTNNYSNEPNGNKSLLGQ